MKNFLVKFLACIFTVCLSLAVFSACDNGQSTNTPQKLSAPIVNMNGNVAYWAANEDADKFEISLNGNLSYVENTVTSKMLTEGQTLKVRAVGNGVNFLTSNWSNSVTYSVGGGQGSGGQGSGGQGSGGQTPIRQEPTYLGIFASKEQPSSGQGVPEDLPINRAFGAVAFGEYRDFDTMLDQLFEDQSNYLGASYPTQTDYEIYSRAGNIVYIQIWLNNPSQYTILSLKLNGTKYQVGGGLNSFFIENGGVHYNCVYVAVTIPNDTYMEFAYVVSDIEYIADTFINADGTDEFMNQNDTIKIGLPYNAQTPTVSNYNTQNLTVNGYSSTFNISDNDGIVALSGGWLGVAIVDDNNYEIVKNQVAVIGENTLTVSGLEENSQYRVTVYLFADLRDGGGVKAHYLYYDWIFTPEAISIDTVESMAVLNDKQTGYVGAIKVKSTLNSTTAEYLKLEILNNEQQVVYTDENYDGETIVSQGILNNKGYTVNIYYKDNEYPQGKSVDQYVFVNKLTDPTVYDEDKYTFINDAIYCFKLGSDYATNYAAVEGFTIRFYDDYSARYIAEDVLCLLENENIIDQLQSEFYSLLVQLYQCEYPSNEYDLIDAEMHAINDRIDSLSHSRGVWESSEELCGITDKTFWETEKAKGKYYYEFTYSGTDTDNIIYANGVYYVILEDINQYGINYDIDVLAKVAKNEGNGLVESKFTRNVKLETLFVESGYNRTDVKDTALNGNEFTYTLYNTYDIKTDDQSNANKRFVYKIKCNGKQIYLGQVPTVPVIDEEAWIVAYIDGIKNGDLDAVALYDTYVPDYATNSKITLDLSELAAGKYNFLIYVRTHGEVYEGDESEDCIELFDVEVYKQFDAPTLEVDGYYLYVKKSEISSSGHIILEAYDKDNISIKFNYSYWDSERQAYRYDFGYQGAKVKAKLSVNASGDDGGGDGQSYWSDSVWTEYYNSEAVEIPTPTFVRQNYSLSWNSDCEQGYIEKYIYVINDGNEQNGSNFNLYSVGSVGCTIKVKAIVSEAGKQAGYCDSEWAVYEYVYTGSSSDKGK